MKPEKQCNRCAVWKPIKRFYITAWKPDGTVRRRGICDTCQCMNTRAYYRNLPPEVKKRVNRLTMARRRARGRDYAAEYRVRKAKHAIKTRRTYRDILAMFAEREGMATWSLNRLIRDTGFTKKTVIKARRAWASMQENSQ